MLWDLFVLLVTYRKKRKKYNLDALSETYNERYKVKTMGTSIDRKHRGG